MNKILKDILDGIQVSADDYPVYIGQLENIMGDWDTFQQKLEELMDEELTRSKKEWLNEKSRQEAEEYVPKRYSKLTDV